MLGLNHLARMVLEVSTTIPKCAFPLTLLLAGKKGSVCGGGFRTLPPAISKSVSRSEPGEAAFEITRREIPREYLRLRSSFGSRSGQRTNFDVSA